MGYLGYLGYCKIKKLFAFNIRCYRALSKPDLIHRLLRVDTVSLAKRQVQMRLIYPTY